MTITDCKKISNFRSRLMERNNFSRLSKETSVTQISLLLLGVYSAPDFLFRQGWSLFFTARGAPCPAVFNTVTLVYVPYLELMQTCLSHSSGFAYYSKTFNIIQQQLRIKFRNLAMCLVVVTTEKI